MRKSYRGTNRVKKQKFIFWGSIICITILGLVCFFVYKQYSSKNTKEVIENTYSSAKVDITGEYISNTGSKAIISSLDHKWKIDYQTSDGKVSGIFETSWKEEGKKKTSTSKMKKSDGYDSFKITIEVFDDKDKLVTVTLSDGDLKHEMIFSNHNDFFKSDNAKAQDLVLKGNLSSFDGVYSNDDLEQSIADSGFTLYAYKPEDYFQNRTSVFPRITGKGNDWNFWSGSSHMQYKLNENKLPRKIGDYYEAYFIGVNQIAVEGKEISVFLVPENIEGPNGDISSEKRIIFGQTNQISFREYQDKWWEKYTIDSVEKQDLDIEAIMKGDYATLVGVWRNGEGLEVIITADGKTNRNESISPNSISNSKFPTLNIRSGNSGAMIALFKIGFRNPYGDQSDSSRPRLVFGQNIGNVPADQYYYKQ